VLHYVVRFGREAANLKNAVVMRCDICGQDKTGIVMVVDYEGRHVVCPDCTRLTPPSFWKHEKPDESEQQEGATRITVT